MGFNQILPLWIRVDLGVMVMKVYRLYMTLASSSDGFVSYLRYLLAKEVLSLCNDTDDILFRKVDWTIF